MGTIKMSRKKFSIIKNTSELVICTAHEGAALAAPSKG